MNPARPPIMYQLGLSLRNLHFHVNFFWLKVHVMQFTCKVQSPMRVMAPIQI